MHWPPRMARVEIQLPAPDQLRLLTLFDDGLEEASKHREAIAGPNLAECRMVWEWLIQIIAHIPPHAQSISHLELIRKPVPSFVVNSHTDMIYPCEIGLAQAPLG